MKKVYFGSLPVDEYQYSEADFVGLALQPSHERELQHDLHDPLPFEDESVEKLHAQDVLEHLQIEKVSSIFDEIYRVLVPGGVFRLSVPDYRSPLLRRRSVYDHNGRVVGDMMMGAYIHYDVSSHTAKARFSKNGDAHIWFPTYEVVNELILQSRLRLCRTIEFWHYIHFDGTSVVRDFPHLEMPVKRCPPRDMRSGGKPISIIVDFAK